ncbi:MAG: histidinol-phosphate transaminase [Burkholderiales bacterium]|nr:histidinol-phosphate transaminase [Burkholderiales bacterium]
MNDPRASTVAIDSAAVAARVKSTIRPKIRALASYPVAKAAGLIKLDAMESPYGLTGEARAEMAAAVANVRVNRYPDGGGDEVVAALRRSLALPDEVALLLGNGSDELLQMLTAAVAKPGAAVLAPDPSFVLYRRFAELANLRFVGVPLRHDLTLDMPAMLAAIERDRPALVWLAYPNNPTGTLFAQEDVVHVIRAAPGVVAVDEAYYAYADASFLSRVLEFPNLIVVRTLSKVGMAGVRLGYATAHPAWIAELDKIRPPYNVNSLTQAVVPVLLAHAPLLAEQAAAIRRERARLATALAALSGVGVFPSHANFLLLRVPDAAHWFATLRDAGILVKNVDGWHPLLANCLRITVGTPAENNALLEALSRYA